MIARPVSEADCFHGHNQPLVLVHGGRRRSTHAWICHWILQLHTKPSNCTDIYAQAKQLEFHHEGLYISFKINHIAMTLKQTSVTNDYYILMAE